MLKNGIGWRRYFKESESTRTVGELIANSAVKMEFHERAHWFESVLRALLPRGSESKDARLRYFLNTLKKNPALAESFRESFLILIQSCSMFRFFSETGYTHAHGLWSEVTQRIFRRILPEAEATDFQDIVARAFTTNEQLDWIETLSPQIIEECLIAFLGDDFQWNGKESDYSIADDLRDAVLLQSVNIAHHGTSLAVRGRTRRRGEIFGSSFLKLSTRVHSGAAIQPELFSECRRDVESIYRKMEDSGVSVGTVHTVEALTAALDRLEILIEFEKDEKENSHRKFAEFLAEVARSAVRARGIRGHIGRHFYLLARKVAERNGHSGEHYIARSLPEYRSLFRSAFFGGIIVVVMTLAKTGVLHLHLPPIFSALAVWLVYSAGFLTMQFCGATLATKIPSFTASRLAQWIKEARSRKDTKAFTHEVGYVVKSQSLGLVGNLVAVIPLAWGINFAFESLMGFSLFSAEYSKHTIADLHPLHSVVIFHGMLTGAELWGSSMIGGWFENLIVFRGVPEAIARHPRLLRIFGKIRAKSISEAFLRNVSGIGTNVSLGFLFGFAPLLGDLIGLNLEGKHVTISTASATVSLASLNSGGASFAIGWTCVGLFFVAVMNFLVSFTLALIVAVRAQNIRRGWALHFFGSLFSRSRSPL